MLQCCFELLDRESALAKERCAAYAQGYIQQVRHCCSSLASLPSLVAAQLAQNFSLGRAGLVYLEQLLAERDDVLLAAFLGVADKEGATAENPRVSPAQDLYETIISLSSRWQRVRRSWRPLL